MSAARPNLLVVTTDEQRWDALSLHGTPGYRTPRLDALARAGVWFDRAYTSAPVCTPARVSLLTGQYSTRHGAYNIGVGPVPALAGPTIATALGSAGYRTALLGKTHFVARTIEDRHVLGRGPTDPEPTEDDWRRFDGPYCGFEYVRHNRHHNALGRPYGHYRHWLEERGADLAHLDAQHGGADAKLRAGPWDVPAELTQNAWLTDETLRFVDTTPAGRPWFAMTHLQDPHYPFLCPEPYYSAVDLDGVDLGGARPGEFDDKPPFYRRFFEGHGFSDHTPGDLADALGGIPDTRPYGTFPDPARCIRAYIGMCNMIDHFVGQLIDGLAARGQRDNTLIVFTSDHGELLGRHGFWYKGIPAYDDNQRIPALLHWPRGQTRGAIGRSRSYFSLVDVVPTLLDAAGAPPLPLVQGVSQLAVLRGETDQVRDWALVDHYSSDRLHQQTFVHDDWKLVVYRHADYGELYDLAQDPDQYRNLWNEPAAQARRAALLHRLVRAEMEAVGSFPPRISFA